MGQKNIKSGISVVGDVAWGTHLCLFYNTSRDLAEILVPYFKKGLENNEFCIWVCWEPLSREKAIIEISKEVGNLESYVSKGQIEIVDYINKYTTQGKSGFDEMVEFWVDKEKLAFERGFQGLRLAGNTYWLGREQWQDFMRYESEVDDVIRRHQMLAICPYSLDKCNPSDILDVISSHRFALIRKEGRWSVIQSIEEERLQTEVEVQTQNFRNSLDDSPLGIRIVTAEGELLYANKATLDIYSYSSFEELKSTPTKQRYTPESYVEHRRRAEDRKLGKPVPDNYEIGITRKDGEVRYLQVFRREVIWNGETQFQAICQDITERKQLEQVLMEERKRLEVTLRSTGDGVITSDMEGKVTLLSRVAEQLTGWKQEDGLGKDSTEVFNIVNEETRTLVESPVRKVIRKGTVVGLANHTILITKDGGEIPIDYTAAVIRDDKGKFLGAVLVFKDVTERKQAEEALRESEERFRIASQIASDVVYERDLQTGIATFYGDIDSHLGYEPGEYPRTMEGFREHVHPEDLAWIDRQSIDQLEPGVPHNIEYRMRKKDGTYMIWWDQIMLMRDEETGKPIKFIGTATNITERKKREKLQHDENYVLTLLGRGAELSELLDAVVCLGEYNDPSIKGSVLLLDPSREYLVHASAPSLPDDFNELLKYGLPIGPNVGSCGTAAYLKERVIVTDIENSPLFKPFEEAVKRAISSGLLSVWSQPIISSNGDLLGTIANYGNKVGEPNADGLRVLEWSARIAAIAIERKQSEERGKQMQQELNLSSRLASVGEMASGIAHEINNPLTSVIGFSQLLLGQNVSDNIKGDLKVINGEAQRVAKIVAGLLTFARQHKVGRESVDTNAIISEVLKLRSHQMEVNNIQVATQLASDLPPTTADAGQLQQVFLNIIINAEKEMIKAHSKGRLLVKSEKVDDIIRISFADDGPGISKENLDKIFDPFFTTREVGNGTGLGLSICHGIVAQHNGRIYAHSDVGKGATFIVELPIVTDAEQIENAAVVEEEPWQRRGAKILVVDDEPAILDFLERLLSEQEYQVETINKAHLALEKINGGKYDLILLDIKMPGMNGIELYQHIEATNTALAERVMFITGDVMETTTKEFLDKTKAEHVSKPINIEQFKRKINNIVTEASDRQRV